MTSRTAMDRPATVLTAILGVVMIGASLPWLIFDDDGKDRYAITWTEALAAEPSAPFGNPNQQIEVTHTGSAQFSNVTVVLECSDTRPAPQLQPAVTITWEAFEDNRSIGSGTTPCAAGDLERIPIRGHSDVGSVRAKSSEEAAADAYGGDNETHTYRLVFTYNRPAGQVPIGVPVGAATFSGRMGMDIEDWRAAANQPQEEVVR